MENKCILCLAQNLKVNIMSLCIHCKNLNCVKCLLKIVLFIIKQTTH